MNIDFEKSKGLVPVIIQNNDNLQVLMLGYMNKEALVKTQQEKRVCFFSRSKNRLWTKGETSGNYLTVNNIQADCDNDTILIKATPKGPTCHKGSRSCFKDKTSKGFIYDLEATISQRIDNNVANSYTNNLYCKGVNKVAQKVGEEAIELIIEAKDNNKVLFENEAADLLYHYLILLKIKGVNFEDIEATLAKRKN